MPGEFAAKVMWRWTKLHLMCGCCQECSPHAAHLYDTEDPESCPAFALASALSCITNAPTWLNI